MNTKCWIKKFMTGIKNFCLNQIISWTKVKVRRILSWNWCLRQTFSFSLFLFFLLSLCLLLLLSLFGRKKCVFDPTREKIMVLRDVWNERGFLFFFLSSLSLFPSLFFPLDFHPHPLNIFPLREERENKKRKERIFSWILLSF